MDWFLLYIYLISFFSITHSFTGSRSYLLYMLNHDSYCMCSYADDAALGAVWGEMMIWGDLGFGVKGDSTCRLQWAGNHQSSIMELQPLVH